MAATSITARSRLLSLIDGVLPASCRLKAGQAFLWSPSQQTIFYNEVLIEQPRGRWALLHEAGHALLGHNSYERDIELVQLEVAAWQEAKRLAKQFKLRIDEDHVQDCLDTYRDWLHQRSTCPRCGLNGLQKTARIYKCLNCDNSWQVTASRFCRPYRRRRLSTNEKLPGHHRPVIFG